MKTTYKIFFAFALFFSTKVEAQVGIGTTNPNSDAILEISSINKGFLPPRMTASQRNSISSPIAGLEIWCTDCGNNGETQIYNGNSWTNLLGGATAGVITTGTNTTGGSNPIVIGASTASGSAQLELVSTTKGFLLPRMTATQRNAIEPATTAAGLQVWCTDCGANGELSIFNGVNWTNSTGSLATFAPPTAGNAICDGTRPTVVKDVSFTYNGTTYTWMDRNLGASRAATAFNDYFAFGCLYQWGRGNDGHANINWTSSTTFNGLSPVISVLSSSTTPGHANFISTSNNETWMSSAPIPETRWQPIDRVNNPCPAGYRIPSTSEFRALYANNNSITTDANSWANSTTKLPVTGVRITTGVSYTPNTGLYHAYNGNFKTNSAGSSYGVYIWAGNTAINVRCIKM